MFSKNSKLAKRTYLALSLTTAMVAAYQPTYVSAAQESSFGSKIVDAVESNSKDQVTTLLSKGINPNERGEFGTSALLRAVNNGNLEIAQILIDKGANANVADLGGATPLHVAARKGNFEMTQFLLNNKADVNLADKEGNTPLMLAAINGNERIVAELISSGAKIDSTNNSGETALLYATQNSAEKVVDMLVAAGAKQDVIDEEGYSIKEVAQRKNNDVLIAKLDSANPNHLVIEMGRGFRPAPAQKTQQVAKQIPSHADKYFAEREEGQQVLAKLADKDAIDYSEAEFLGDPDLAPILTPRFSQIEPAAGEQKVASTETGVKKSWLAGLKKSFDEAGAFELASVKNFTEGNKYAILELGSFKVKAFAEKRISELQMDNMDILGDVPLVIFERGTGANIEYTVNGGIFENRAEADSICQKLVARGLRCTPVESAMITNEQYAKFNAPVKSEFSAPEVEAVNIPDVPKSDSAATSLPTLAPAKAIPAKPIVTAGIPTLPGAKPAPAAMPTPPAPPAPMALAQAKPASPVTGLPTIETTPAAKALASAAPATPPAPPAPNGIPTLKPLAKIDAKPASPVVDAKSIAAHSVPKEPTPVVDSKSIAANTPKAPLAAPLGAKPLAAPAPVANTLPASPPVPIQVKPEISTVKTVALGNDEKTEDDLSLIERAGMAQDTDDAKKPVEKSKISSLVDSIYSEKAAATTSTTEKAPAPVRLASPAPVPAPKAPENIDSVKKQLESLPSLPGSAAGVKPATPAPAVTAAALNQPMKIVFSEPGRTTTVNVPAQPAAPAAISSPATSAPSLISAPADASKGIKVAEFKVGQAVGGTKLANESMAQPNLVNPIANKTPVLPPLAPVAVTPPPAPAPISFVAATPAPAPLVTKAPAPALAPMPAPAPVPPHAPVKVVAEVAESVTIPAMPTPNGQPAASVDKFRVAKPVRVDDTFSAVPNVAPPAQNLAATYSNASSAVTYNNAYIPPAHTFNRRENRRMARVDYFATPTAAQGLYWKYRQAGVLNQNITVRATKDILHGVHYSALIGEFSTSAEANAFCNTVYKAEKLRCTVQDELDYTSTPNYRNAGSAKTYSRHSNYAENTINVGRHSQRQNLIKNTKSSWIIFMGFFFVKNLLA